MADPKFKVTYIVNNTGDTASFNVNHIQTGLSAEQYTAAAGSLEGAIGGCTITDIVINSDTTVWTYTPEP